MIEIDIHELKRMRDEGVAHQLIDVREIHEVESCTLGGHHIPMGEILERHEEIRADVPVIVHCRSGARSGAVVTALINHFGFEHVHSLRGGIVAWAQEIDPSLDLF